MRRIGITLGSLVFVAALIFHSVPELHGVNDVDLYESIGKRVAAMHNGQGVSINSEYPPLATGVFWFVSRFPVVFENAWATFIFLFVGAAIVFAGIVGKDRDPPVIACGAFAGSQLLSVDLAFGRFDVLVGTLLALMLVMHRQRWYAAGALFLVTAAMIKAVPAAIFPFYLLAVPRIGRLRAVAGAFLGGALSVIVPLAILGPRGLIENIRYFLEYHGGRGVQHESTLSGLHALVLWFNGLRPSIVFSHSTLENSSIHPAVASAVKVLILLLIGAYFAAVWRKKSKKAEAQFDTIVLGLLLLLLSLAPVLSPQYFMWVFPVAIVWCANRALDRA